jgi:DNA-binding transcriptional LysR family regulator
MRWTDRIGRRLNPHDLHVFMAVVEQGNMARAADALAISRPVVSRTIANLEHTLGVRLIDRGPQGVEPTQYGRALLKRSVAVFDELKQSVQDIEFLGDPNSGEVRIGCSEPLAAGLVSAVIDRLSRQYPRLVFHLEIGTPSVLRYRILRERKCDLVIARQWDAQPEPDIEIEVLFEDQIRVVAGPRSKWLRRRGLTLADLVDEPWILAPTDHQPDSPAFEIFRACGLQVPRASVLSYSLSERNNLLATGRFLAIVPASVLRFGAEHVLLKDLGLALSQMPQPVAVATLRNRMLNPAAQLFIDCARVVARPLANAAGVNRGERKQTARRASGRA